MNRSDKKKIIWIAGGIVSLALVNVLLFKFYPGDFSTFAYVLFILIPLFGTVMLIFFRFSAIFLKRISEKEEEEKLLREREKEIVENMVEGLIVHSQNGRILTVNNAAAKMIGLDGNQLKRKVFSEIKNPSPLLEAVFMNTNGGEFEYSLKNPNGQDYVFQIAKVVLNKEKGEILKIIRDISRAKYLDKMKTEYVTIMSHKFLTPLTNIKWAASALMDKNIDWEKREENSKNIMENAEKLVKFTSYLLEITEIEEGLFIDRFEKIDLMELVEDAVQNYSQESIRKDISIIFNGGKKGAYPARGDKLRLAAAISNYFNNAIKYTPEKGRVDVELKKEKGFIRLSIKDNGIGVSPESVPLLFTKFFRDKLAKQVHTEGSGIGLFIVKNIIERHGGVVGYEPNKNGVGSTFYFTLPEYKENI